MNKKVKNIFIAIAVLGVVACIIGGIVEYTRVPYVEGTLNELVNDYYAK